MFQIEQKNLLQEQKIFVNENHVQSEHINALYFSRLCVAFCEISWSCMAFFDRELYSKVLKEAFLLLLFFLLAWKHDQKMFQLEQTNFAKWNCSKWLCMALCGLVDLMWPFVAVCGLEWPYVASYGLKLLILFTAMAMYGSLWPSAVLYGLLWPCYCLILYFMVFYGRISSFLAVKDPNSFGFVLWKDAERNELHLHKYKILQKVAVKTFSLKQKIGFSRLNESYKKLFWDWYKKAGMGKCFFLWWNRNLQALNFDKVHHFKFWFVLQTFAKSLELRMTEIHKPQRILREHIVIQLWKRYSAYICKILLRN